MRNYVKLRGSVIVDESRTGPRTPSKVRPYYQMAGSQSPGSVRKVRLASPANKGVKTPTSKAKVKLKKAKILATPSNQMKILPAGSTVRSLIEKFERPTDGRNSVGRVRKSSVDQNQQG